MRTILFSLTVGLAFGAVPSNVGILGPVAPTMVKIGFTSSCPGTATVIVSESPTLSPVVNDLNLTFFPSANTDNILSTTDVGGGLYRTEFLVGHRDAPTAATGAIKGRALAAGTPHYGSVTCGGEVTLFSFTTGNLSGLTPQAPLWISTGHGNTDIESFDFADKTKPIIDPLNGAKIYRVSNSTDRGWTRPDTFPANSVAGGSGWMNLQDLVNTSKAMTGNTNYAFTPFMVASDLTFAGFSISEAVYSFQLANVGISLTGSATNTTGTNADVEACLSVDGGQSCYTDLITVTLTGSTTTVGPSPSTYAQNGFIGWSKPIPAELRMNQGYVTVSGSTVTVTGGLSSSTLLSGAQASTAWARPNWTPGIKIYIAGASSSVGCTNDFCTLASVTNRNTFTIVESGTIASPALYRSMGFGVMLRKKTATGTVTMQATYTNAGYSIFQQGQNVSCSTVEVTSTVDKNGNPGATPGHLCLLNEMRDTFTGLWFIGNAPGDFRYLSQLSPPSSIPGYATDDLPYNAGFRRGPSSSGLLFSPTDGNKFYTINQTLAAGLPSALWALTYSGDYTSPTGIANSFSVAGSISGYTDPVTWANLTKPSESGRTLVAQIAANTPYTVPPWPSQSLTLSGVDSGYAVIQTCCDQGTAAWVFMFSIETGNFSSFYNTLQTAAGYRFAGFHNVTPVAGDANNASNAFDQLSYGFSGLFAGGPYLTDIACVYKSGVCNADTSVSGTIGDGSYDATCPLDIPAEYQALGATGNQCLTVQIVGEPCSLTPSSDELAAYPCPNPSSTGQSWIGTQTALGDSMTKSSGDKDVTWNMLVKKTPTTATSCAAGGRCELVFLRDSSNGYNCVEQAPPGSQVGTRGRNCVDSVAQNAMSNGWSGRWIPSSLIPVYGPRTQTFSRENAWLGRGHYDRAVSPAGVASYVGINPNGYFARIGGVVGGPATANLQQWPPFAGILSNAGGGSGWMQSYISAPGSAATGIATQVGSDWRIIANAGVNAEDPGIQIGNPQTFHLEAGTTGIYRLSTINGTYNPKKNVLVGWSGMYLWKEKSSATTGNTLTDSDAWNVCYAVNANECRTGSTAGQVFAVVPNAELGSANVVDTTGTSVTRFSGTVFNNVDNAHDSLISINDVSYTVSVFLNGDSLILSSSAGSQSHKIAQWNTGCNQGQISYRSSCLFAAGSVFGQTVQMGFVEDPEGIYQRATGRNLTRPGAQYSYSHARTLPNGKCFLSTAYQLYGWWSGAVQVCPGAMIDDSVNRTAFTGVPVSCSTAACAAGTWVVRAGTTPEFYCTPRAEACVADTTTTAIIPMKFAGETAAPKSGTGTITVAAKPGTLLYLAIVVDGVVGATRTMIVP